MFQAQSQLSQWEVKTWGEAREPLHPLGDELGDGKGFSSCNFFIGSATPRGGRSGSLLLTSCSPVFLALAKTRGSMKKRTKFMAEASHHSYCVQVWPVYPLLVLEGTHHASSICCVWWHYLSPNTATSGPDQGQQLHGDTGASLSGAK